MKVDEQLIRHVAKTARLNLSEKEIKKFESDFKEILSNFQKLDKISVDGIKPSFHPIELKNVMREDIEGKCLDNENALSNSAHKSEGYFKGPKII